MFNDRNLTIVAITILVIVYIVLGGDTTDKGEIVEKAILALGALTTGSVIGNKSRIKDMLKKPPKGE